jgi:hypothetical protein
VDRGVSLVLLGICTAFKEDLQASVTELVYGEPLRIPRELLTPTTDQGDPAHLITEFRQHMARLRPVPAARHASPATFMHSDPEKCTHVFFRQDTTRLALETPYSGPYQCLLWREDAATPCAQEARHCVKQQGQVGLHPQRDRPQEELQPTSRNNSSHGTTCCATTVLHTNYTLRSPHPFPHSPQHLSNHLHGGGGGMVWEPSTIQNRHLPKCSKSRLYLYTAACSLAVCTPTNLLY